jgi:hypothetical protein
VRVKRGRYSEDEISSFGGRHHPSEFEVALALPVVDWVGSVLIATPVNRNVDLFPEGLDLPADDHRIRQSAASD